MGRDVNTKIEKKPVRDGFELRISCIETPNLAWMKPYPIDGGLDDAIALGLIKEGSTSIADAHIRRWVTAELRDTALVDPKQLEDLGFNRNFTDC